MHSLEDMLSTVKPSSRNPSWEAQERTRLQEEFARAALTLGVSVDLVRVCADRHDSSEWMSGIHYHAVGYRAYDMTFDCWIGPPCTLEEAQARVVRHQKGQVAQGGGASRMTVARAGGREGRLAVHALDDKYGCWQAGDPVWPGHGRSSGAVRWGQ